jgi:hypothetical protein
LEGPDQQFVQPVRLGLCVEIRVQFVGVRIYLRFYRLAILTAGAYPPFLGDAVFKYGINQNPVSHDLGSCFGFLYVSSGIEQGIR